MLFGEIIDNTMQLNDLGKIAHNEWHRLRNRWQGVAIDEVCVVMPNYMHGIVTYGDVPRPSRIPELSNVIARYKADVTRSARKYIRDFKMQIWQARFNDRVVRDENELSRIRQYILTRHSRNQSRGAAFFAPGGRLALRLSATFFISVVRRILHFSRKISSLRY